jgi:hypothetical protein
MFLRTNSASFSRRMNENPEAVKFRNSVDSSNPAVESLRVTNRNYVPDVFFFVVPRSLSFSVNGAWHPCMHAMHASNR